MLRNAAFIADPPPRRKRRDPSSQPAYRDWAAGNLFCVITGSLQYVLHHLRADETGPMGVANHDDRYMIPIHPAFHDGAQGVHGPDGEKGFLAMHGIHDPVGLARELFASWEARDIQRAVAALLNARKR